MVIANKDFQSSLIFSSHDRCQNLDEFYSWYSHIKSNQQSNLLSNKENIAISQPSTLREAYEIVGIYRAIYGNSYPYKEMLDPNYIFASFTKSTFYWGVFRDIRLKSSKSSIIGCFTFEIDFNSRSAYMRGLNIHPHYQKKVNCKQLAYGLIHQFFNEYHDHIDKWYNEARTAHDIVQYLSYQIGANPYAFLEGKDYFNNQKESDLLMISYFNRALYETRYSPEKIHNALISNYSHIASQHGFSDPIEIITYNDNEFIIDPREVLQTMKEINRSYTQDSHGYTHIRLFHQQSGSSLIALHTHSVKNIEKITYQYTNINIMMAFIACLHQYQRNHHIEYIEYCIPVEDTEITQILLTATYKIGGYLPAWIPGVGGDVFHDAALLFWRAPDVKIPIPTLIKAAKYLDKSEFAEKKIAI